MRQPLAIVAFAVSSISMIAVFHEWGRGTLSRHRKGENFINAFLKLIMGNRPRYGGYVVHLSIVMLAFGAIGSSFYDVQRDFPLAVGESASLGGYSFTYLSFDFDQFSDRDGFTAKFDVWNEEDHIGIIQSTRSFYPGFKISSTRAGIRSNLLEDFYIVPSEFQVDGQAVFRVYISPLVWWMWASGPLLVLGVLIAISPRRKPKSSLESVVASGNLHRT